MALTAYLTATQALLHDEAGKLYSPTDLTSFINTARSQIALESAALRVIPANNNTVVGQESYSFATVNALVAATAGVKEILAVKSVAVAWGTLTPTLRRWTWPEFQARFRAIQTVLQGWPENWSQYGNGPTGAIFFWPWPAQVSAMVWDCVCRPVDLVTDATAEALPWPWTDAVQYYAAYMALLSVQRPQQADVMFGRYEKFMQRAAAMTTPEFVPDQYD